MKQIIDILNDIHPSFIVEQLPNEGDFLTFKVKSFPDDMTTDQFRAFSEFDFEFSDDMTFQFSNSLIKIFMTRYYHKNNIVLNPVTDEPVIVYLPQEREKLKQSNKAFTFNDDGNLVYKADFFNDLDKVIAYTNEEGGAWIFPKETPLDGDRLPNIAVFESGMIIDLFFYNLNGRIIREHIDAYEMMSRGMFKYKISLNNGKMFATVPCPFYRRGEVFWANGVEYVAFPSSWVIDLSGYSPERIENINDVLHEYEWSKARGRFDKK